jgi:hypothetical protein
MDIVDTKVVVHVARGEWKPKRRAETKGKLS